MNKTDLVEDWADTVFGHNLRAPGATDFLATSGDKFDLGDRKYGPDSWQHHDMLGELLTELVDVYNYCYLEWAVLRTLNLQDTNFLVNNRIEGTLRRLALEAFNSWATLRRTQGQLDELGISRSVSGQNRLGVQQSGGSDESRNGGSPDAAGGSGDREVPGEPDDATEAVRSAQPATRRRRSQPASETV